MTYLNPNSSATVEISAISGKETNEQYRKLMSSSEIKNGQTRENGNIQYTRLRKTKHNMCWTPLYTDKYDGGKTLVTNKCKK